MAQAIVKSRPGVGSVALADAARRPPAAGEVVVEVAYAGVCGTDLHILDGEWPTEPPVVMGHELSGTIVDVGAGVAPELIGAAVVAEVFLTDGTCDFCRRGMANLCDDRRSIGSKADGAFTRHVVLPRTNVHVLPRGLDLTVAVFSEPLACVVGALQDPAVIAPGDRVLVTGPGTVGLLAAQVARGAGGRVEVVGMPSDAGRLELAEALGFTVRGKRAVTVAEEVREQFDVVIECSGAGAAVDLCLEAAVKAGTFVQLGIFGKPVTADLDLVCLKRLSWVSGFGASGHAMERAVELLAAGTVEVETLITRVAPLDEWESVFEATRQGHGMKFLFAPAGREADHA